MPALAAIGMLSAPSNAKKPAKTSPKPRSDEVFTTSSRAWNSSAEILVLHPVSTFRMADLDCTNSK